MPPDACADYMKSIQRAAAAGLRHTRAPFPPQNWPDFRKRNWEPRLSYETNP